MKFLVNNKEVISETNNLLQLTHELNLPEKGVAVAVNNRMISRTQWANFTLHENDNLVVIKAACGG